MQESPRDFLSNVVNEVNRKRTSTAEPAEDVATSDPWETATERPQLVPAPAPRANNPYSRKQWKRLKAYKKKQEQQKKGGT